MKQKVFKKIIVAFILIMIVLIGFLSRIYKAGTYPLWSDEAETVINSQQILNGELPNGYYKGEPSFENFIKIPAPALEKKYAYLDKNYNGLKYERNKGWLTYYLLAGWLKLFGFSAFNARLPFIIISTFSILALFFLVKELYGKKIGLISGLLYAVNLPLIEYNRMCRYYSLMILLNLLCLYFFLKLFKTRKTIYYYLTTFSLVGLFHTHIVAFFGTALFILVAWFYYRMGKFNKTVVMNIIILLLLTLPWLILVKFWVNIDTHFSGGFKIIWLLNCFLIIFLIYYINALVNIIFKKRHQISFKNISFLNLFYVIYIFITVLLIPEESAGYRLLLPVFVLMNASLIYCLSLIINKSRRFLLMFAVLAIIIIYVYLTMSSIGVRNVYRPYWVNKARDYLLEQKVPAETQIFMRNQWQALSILVPNQVQLFETVREEYIKSLKEFYLFALNNNKEICLLLPKFKCDSADKNYQNIAKNCSYEYLGDGLFVFHCNQKP